MLIFFLDLRAFIPEMLYHLLLSDRFNKFDLGIVVEDRLIKKWAVSFGSDVS